MKNLSLFILLISVLFISGSCKKEPLITPEQPDNPWNYHSKLDVKWYKYFYSDTTGAFFYNPYTFDNYVIFCSYMIASGNDNKGIGIAVYNKQTGEKHHLWPMDPSTSLNLNHTISDWLIGGENNRYAVFFSGKYLSCFDLTAGSLAWTNQLQGRPRISSFGNYLFQSNENSDETYSKLIRFDIQNGNSSELFTITSTNGYRAGIEPPSGWVSPSGDTILIFQNRQWNFSLSKGKVDIYAYNMNRDSVMWVLEDLTQDGNSSIFKPIINGNRMFFQGMLSNHCINLHTGQLVWEKEYDASEGFAQVDNLYADGKLFAHSGSGSVIAYDANTGVELWKTNPDYSIIESGCMGYYNGKLYFNANDDLNPSTLPNYLFCLDANTGNLLWKDSGVVRSGMKGGIYIDQATGLLYAQDSYRIMCIDLNRTPRFK